MQSFIPYPLLGNPHVQTVLGNFVGRGSLTMPSVRFTVPLADGDRVVVHGSAAPGWQRATGRAARPRARRLPRVGLHDPHDAAPGRARACVYRMDLRGCGAGAGLAQRLYCAACSDDVRTVLAWLHARHPDAPLLLAGFSLGGGIVLKTAGEAGDQPPAGLCAVAAVAAPLDLPRCSALLAGLPFYDAFFVRHLLHQVRRQQHLLPHLPRVRFPRRLTLRQFDDFYTAPRWGYAGVDDYYQCASALPWVRRIRIPAFLLTARDDPFIAVGPFETLPPTPLVEVHVSPRGGHLGFLGPDGAGGGRWAERQVVDWLLRRSGFPA